MSLDAYISDLNTNHALLQNDDVTLPENETIVWDGPDSVSEHNEHETDEDNWYDDDEDEDEPEPEPEPEPESEITLSESQAADLIE